MVTREIYRSGSTYYGTGVSSNTDFKTVFDAVAALSASGDAIHLAGNTIYVFQAQITFIRTGVTITADSGAVFQHGSNLGDYPLIVLRGSYNILQGVSKDDVLWLDDNWYAGGSNGAASVEGDHNSIWYCGVINCERYGILYWNGTNFKILYNDLRHAQHCISGATGGTQPISVDGEIAYNKVAGMILEGIKLKHGKRIWVHHNEIDIAATYPGYRGGTTTYSKQGVYFSHDGPNIDCIVENNHIYNTLPSVTNGYGFLCENNIYGLNQSAPSIAITTGNIIRNNPIEGPMRYGVCLGNPNDGHSGDNFTVYGNDPMPNVDYPYINLGQNNLINPPILVIQTPSGSGTTSPATGAYAYASGSSASVAATPSTGHAFSHWLLDGINAGTDATIAVPMNADHTLQAVFVPSVAQFTFTMEPFEGQGTVIPTVGSYLFDSGAQAPCEAIPAANWEFDHWLIDGTTTTTTNPGYLNMMADRSIKAYFTEIMPLGITHTIYKVGSTYYARTEATGAVTSSTNFETLFEGVFQSNRVIQMLGPAVYYVPSVGGLSLSAKTNVKVYGAEGVIIRQALPSPAQLVLLLDQINCSDIYWYDVVFDQDYLNPNHLPYTSYGMMANVKPGGNINAWFIRCKIINSPDLAVLCGDVTGLHFIDTDVDYCGEHVFYLTSIKNLEVKNCKVYNWAKYGRGFAFKLTACEGVDVADSWFEPNADGLGYRASGIISDPASGVYGPVIMDYCKDIYFARCTWKNVAPYAERNVGLRIALDYPVYNINFTDCKWYGLGTGPVIDPNSYNNAAQLHLTNCTFTIISPTQFTFTMEPPEGQGTVTPTVGTYLYDATDPPIQVPVEAIPTAGWRFDHWLIDGVNTSTNNPGYLNMGDNRTIKAVFSALPIPSHILVVTTTPIIGVPIILNGQNYTTPTPPITLTEGSHSVSCPSNVIVGSDTYNFSQWEDGSTSPQRTFPLTADATILATYVLPPPPPKGNIEVHSFLDQQEIVANGVVVETGETFVTPFTLQENPGNYVVRVTLSEVTKELIAPVTLGQTIRLDFQFTTAPIPPPPSWTPLAIGTGLILLST